MRKTYVRERLNEFCSRALGNHCQMRVELLSGKMASNAEIHVRQSGRRGGRPGRTPSRSPSQVDDSTMVVGDCGEKHERDGVSLGHPTSLMTRWSTTAGDVHYENR